ncbi:MAG: aquaporin family protein [Hungatella sp.]|jgi:glycerol uptake facilitator protein|uniref:MIP family channel protein n=1 Tax=Clostridium sp. NkU-1 TaxID=1095009 RepID=UPI0006D0E381|nr:aquaporin family protein [Hungatella sp.]MDR1547399.1 aquaporin family protein [Hungatella sp.]MDR2022163.1 aquaporin family protein [Hungatella sp.]
MLMYLAEFLGTMILILLGDGVVANVNLDKSGMKGGGSIQVSFAWGFAVMIPAFIFGAASGAHFNPAVTIALAADGSLPWDLVPGYVIAQFAGAFTGAVLVYLLFKDQLDATECQATKRGVFCTSPAIPNTGRNLLSEIVGTFVLVFAIKGIGQAGAVPAGVNNILVFAIIVSIGMSLGGLTGYAINPARDLGPRLAHAVLPIKDKGSSNWKYAPIVLFGPVIGGLAAVLLYSAIPWV